MLLLLGRRRLRLEEQASGERHSVMLDAHQVGDLAAGFGARCKKGHAPALGPGALRQVVAGPLRDQRAGSVTVVQRGFIQPGQVDLQQPAVLASVDARYKPDTERIATSQQQRVAFRPNGEGQVRLADLDVPHRKVSAAIHQKLAAVGQGYRRLRSRSAQRLPARAPPGPTPPRLECTEPARAMRRPLAASTGQSRKSLPTIPSPDCGAGRNNPPAGASGKGYRACKVPVGEPLRLQIGRQQAPQTGFGHAAAPGHVRELISPRSCRR